MYVVNFPNGSQYKATLASNKQEAIEHGWTVEVNAMIHGQGHGYKNKSDFVKKIVITKEKENWNKILNS